MLKIGQNLKKARINAGLTQKDVESHFGLRDLSMKDFETERLKLPAEMAAKLAEFYNISISQLLSEEPSIDKKFLQNSQLMQISSLFNRGEMDLLYHDPVIRAYLEDFLDQILDYSIFDLLTISMSKKEKNDFSEQILKTLGTLMSVDNKITECEMNFFNSLINQLGIVGKQKSISRSMTLKHLPELKYFMQRNAAKHFLVWMMFYLAKSDGEITFDEIHSIEECAETLKLNRSNFLTIKKHFIKGSN